MMSMKGLCIPRVSISFTKEKIHEIFSQVFGKDKIMDIQMIFRKGYAKYKKHSKIMCEDNNLYNKDKHIVSNSNQPYYLVFIYFTDIEMDIINNNDIHMKRLLEGKDIKIVYNFPWFWKCSLIRE